MKNTGERFLPEFINTETGLEHLHRYNFALNYISNKSVLDIASGEGYGSNILANKAKSVLGIDISTQAIEHAKSKYAKNNLTFTTGSCTNFGTQELFDAIISFETLEHVDQKSQGLFLAEIKKHLLPNGLLIISTPNKTEYSLKRNFNNKFHKHELTTLEFINFLNKYFKNVITYKQKIVASSIIYNDSQKAFDFSSVPNFDETYVICVCSDIQITVEPNTVLFDSSANIFEKISTSFLKIEQNFILRYIARLFKV